MLPRCYFMPTPIILQIRKNHGQICNIIGPGFCRCSSAQRSHGRGAGDLFLFTHLTVERCPFLFIYLCHGSGEFILSSTASQRRKGEKGPDRGREKGTWRLPGGARARWLDGRRRASSGRAVWMCAAVGAHSSRSNDRKRQTPKG